MKITKLILPTLLIIASTIAFGQKGKDGTPTLTYPAYVNEYTSLTSDASSGSATISVSNSSLNSNGRFAGNLEAGDLIMIIQIQGVDMIGYPEPWTGNETYGLPNNPTWGEITNYYNCGNNEFAEVKSVPNGTSIELRCGLNHSYTSAGVVQIVRVPRYEDLTVSGTLTTDAWDGAVGGIIAIEVNGDLVVSGTGDILASELGFRGGIPDAGASEFGVTHRSRPDADAGGLKGESVRGWATEYIIHGGEYCKGAPANSGGGGNAHNAGGGGGGNAGDFANWNEGVGVPFGTYAAWSLEAIDITGFISTGGGRGGYTFSGTGGLNPNSVAPGDVSWGGDYRRNNGGLGGRPLDYSGGRIYLGGAGGAGDINEPSTIGGGGGNGGGIVYILNYGSVSGSGSITSNGENGEDATAASASLFNVAGTDGAGGAGAGGTVLINSNNPVIGINISTDGGDGGNQIIIDGGFGDMDEAEGPGGGGGGGYIAISNGSVTRSASGGLYGVTNSEGIDQFPMNGATSGGVGLPNETISNFFLTTTNDTICSGATSTLTATVTGTLSGTITWYDAEVGGNIIGTNILTTGALTSDTVFYVGTCPGNYLIPVFVTVGMSVDTSNVTVTNDACTTGSGSIAGIIASGGASPYTYSWNGNTSVNADTTSLFAGNYTLTISDVDGCVFISNPYTILDNSGPTIDTSSMFLTEETCSLANGEIAGITSSGGLSPFTYSWNGSSTASEDTAGLSGGNYTLTVTDGNGCFSTMGPIVVNSASPPTIDTSLINITHEDCYASNGSITGISVNNGATPYIYNWNGTTGSIGTTNLASGSYIFSVTDNNGCTVSLGAITINNSGVPVADFTLSGDPLAIGESLTLTNVSTGAVSYLWDLGNGNTSTEMNPSSVYLNDGSYSICLIAYTASSCTDTTCKTITIIEEIESTIGIPSAFSPNNDTHNDVLYVRGSGVVSFTIMVFNRYGEKVFETTDLNEGWDGNFKGKPENAGVFAYYIEYELANGERGELKGNVTLVK